MFNNLIESKAKRQRTAGGMFMSFVIHTVLIGGAVYATANAAQKLEKPKAEKVDFVTVQKKEPPPPPKEKAPPPDVVAAPPPPKGFQVLTAPIKIPDVLPKIDLSKSVTNAADFTGKGVAGGSSKGVVGGTAPPNENNTFYAFQVEKQVEADAEQPRAPLSRHAAVGERGGRGGRPVRRRHQRARRHEHLQGAQVHARIVHAGGQERVASGTASSPRKSAARR